MSSGLSFFLCLLSLLSSVLVSLSGRVFTHGSKKISSSSKILFLPAQPLEQRTSLSQVPEKVLELALIDWLLPVPIRELLPVAWEINM